MTTRADAVRGPGPSWREGAAALLLIAAAFLLIFGSVLDAGFYVVEDHILFRRAPTALADWWTRVVIDLEVYGRLRPGYYAYVTASFAAWGDHPRVWHAAGLVWGTTTCWFLYAAMRTIGGDIVSSIVFVLILALTGSQNWIWINLIPAETAGMLWCAAAAFTVVRAAREPRGWGWRTAALVTMVLAGLTKESFVLLVPAFLALWVGVHRASHGEPWAQSLRSLRVPLLVGGAFFVLQMAAIVATLVAMPAAASASAAGVSGASFDPRHWLELLAAIPLDLRVALGATPIVAIGAWMEGRERREPIATAAVVATLWMVPQLVLYRNGMQERYLFPFIVGVAGAVALALAALRRSGRFRWAWPIAVVALMPVLGRGVSATVVLVEPFVAETKAVQRMITFLAQNVPAGDPILMAGDSGTAYGFEATYSLPMYLKAAGRDGAFYLWPLVSSGERSPVHITASRDNTAFKYPDALTPGEVGAIVIVDKWVPSFDFDPLVRWLGGTAWREVSFSEPYETFSWRRPGYARAGSVTHRVLLPAALRGAPADRPLVTIEPSLAGTVSPGQLLDGPPWGLEPDYAGPGSIVWLGQGDAEGLAGTLTSTREQPVVFDLEVVPGPSRADTRRQVELAVEMPGRPATTLREVLDGGRWTFAATLGVGLNRFRLRVLDEATVAVQPNGDTRHLLVLVRRVTIRPGPTP